MSSKIIIKLQKNIQDLETQRREIITEMLGLDQILRGACATVHTRCGIESCKRCKSKGHPHTRLSWSEKGEGYTRKVPKDEIPWVLETTKHYKRFRELRRQLKKQELKTKVLVGKLEDELVNRTRKPKPYIWLKNSSTKET